MDVAAKTETEDISIKTGSDVISTSASALSSLSSAPSSSSVPFPKVEVEDHDYHAMALEFLQLTCWISGFFFWLFAFYLVYVVYVYHNLLWVSRPWDRQTWNLVRVAADQVLVQGKGGREETVQDQFDRMIQKQQEEMKKYKRTLMEPAKKLGV